MNKFGVIYDRLLLCVLCALHLTGAMRLARHELPVPALTCVRSLMDDAMGRTLNFLTLTRCVGYEKALRLDT